MTEEKRTAARILGVIFAFAVAKFLNLPIRLGALLNILILIFGLYIVAKKRAKSFQKFIKSCDLLGCMILFKSIEDSM